MDILLRARGWRSRRSMTFATTVPQSRSREVISLADLPTSVLAMNGPVLLSRTPTVNSAINKRYRQYVGIFFYTKMHRSIQGLFLVLYLVVPGKRSSHSSGTTTLGKSTPRNRCQDHC